TRGGRTGTAEAAPPPATRSALRASVPAASAAQPAAARPGKTLGPARNGATDGTAQDAEPASARAPARSTASPAVAPTSTGKTLGRAAPQPSPGARRPGAGLTRAEVRARIADRLAGRLTPAGLATWARGEWVALQRGAAVEAGQRDQLEEVLQALFLSVQPKSALSEHQLVEWMAALE
ncbi:MAG TPA: hypothetical protein VFF12_04535, partial [Myxococcaceae bacterium]|nr:hypothetical protein [Myxococcaceae bacterium]